MKNLYKLLSAVVIMIASACNDHHCNMVTRINPDGSCYREFTESADSAFMIGDISNNRFPMRLDSTWKISWTYSPDGKGQYSNNWPVKSWAWDTDTSKHLSLNVKATKYFASTKEMEKQFRFNNSNWKSLVPQIKFEKKFKWFFTYYSYKELFAKYNPLKLVPVEKYLTTDEISMYFGDNPKFSPELNGTEIKDLLDNIDRKKEEWLNRSVFEEYYQVIQKNYPEIKGNKIDKMKFISAKDSVYNSLKDTSGIDTEVFMKSLDNYFKTSTFSTFLKNDTLISSKLQSVNDNIEKPFRMDIDYHLLMPGKIIETNSNQLLGDTLRWKIDAYRFFFTDFAIVAKSRVANFWAFLVSGLFVLGVVLVFLKQRR